ncbi:HAD family hydrolase [Desulfonatronovibrio hydrogenovorans]|uniref:HAD family hydrolase n=1 Tax=Desulfonatronovibrio hydrogenovorans TaxID=53245 RepID=UPI00054E8511|nr:HAD family hydrolase [Desulfonatronovibrio hydrogenovorans]
MQLCNPFLKDPGLKEIKGIVFDCDGVLFDSKDVNIHFYNQVRSCFDLSPMSKEQEDFVHMHSVQESFNHILPLGYESELSKIKDKLDYSSLLPHMRMEEGLVELLELLSLRKIKTAINTNRTTTMDLLLATFGLDKYFWPVVTASDVSRPKPHPESLFKIMDIWSVSAREMVFIGDSIVDQETAQGADVQFWGYKNDGLQAKMLVPDFWILRDFLMRNLD